MSKHLENLIKFAQSAEQALQKIDISKAKNTAFALYHEHSNEMNDKEKEEFQSKVEALTKAGNDGNIAKVAEMQQEILKKYK